MGGVFLSKIKFSSYRMVVERFGGVSLCSQLALRLDTFYARLNSQTRTGGDVNLDCSQACRLWSSRLGHGNYMAQSMADRQGVAPDYQTRNIQPITVCPSK